MHEISAPAVSEMLRTAFLIHPVFDPPAIAIDLNGVMESAGKLDELIGSGAPPDPTSFDPRWR